MKPVLPDSVASPEQLESVIMALRSYAAGLRQRAVQVARGVAVGVLDDSAVAEILAQLPSDQRQKPEAVESLASELDQQKLTLPVIRVILPAVASHSYKAELVAWLRRNLHPQVLVSFGLDRTLGGGAVLRVGSKVYDWSFATKILDGRNQLAGAFHAQR